MSKHFWVNSNDSIDTDDRLWITNSHVFSNIFDRVKKLFQPHEFECRDICYHDWGIEGIDLSEVPSECFNIFYLRCVQALNKYPDKEEEIYQKSNPNEFKSHEHIIMEWKEIIKRLEIDSRYDKKWIEEYKINQQSQSRSVASEKEQRGIG